MIYCSIKTVLIFWPAISLPSKFFTADCNSSLLLQGTIKPDFPRLPDKTWALTTIGGSISEISESEEIILPCGTGIPSLRRRSFPSYSYKFILDQLYLGFVCILQSYLQASYLW